jgi:hypothetical protein
MQLFMELEMGRFHRTIIGMAIGASLTAGALAQTPAAGAAQPAPAPRERNSKVAAP